jgi:triacylglycerol esterase/lipase EstA (alpha/beta hydrolase family)
MSSIPQIHGLKVFDNPTSCIADFENMHWTKKAVSFIQSFGTFFMYGFTKVGLLLNSVDAEMDPLTRLSLEDGSKKRLIVCIHGLNNNPTQFKSIVAELQKKDLSGACIFIPRILQKGNAKLDEMVQPIFEEIKEWAENSGDKELVLVGISNGGRIARAIEAEIAKSENSANIKKMHFVSIVGACKGSSLVNLVNKLGLSWLLSKNI